MAVAAAGLLVASEGPWQPPAASAADAGEDPPQWRAQNDGVNGAMTMSGVSFADHREGLAVGFSGTLQATVDGGDTWVPRPFPAEGELQDVVLADAGHAVVVGNEGLWTSDDGGVSWTKRDVAADNLQAVTMVAGPDCDADQPRCYGWAVGGTPKGYTGVFHTTDGGESWARQGDDRWETGGTVSACCLVTDVSFVDHTTGWAVTLGGAILHTDDGGETWTEQAGETAGVDLTTHRIWLRGVDCVDQQRCWAVGRTTGGTGVGRIMHTDDGGQTWQRQEHPAPGTNASTRGYGFNDVEFVDDQRGYAVGGFQDSDALVYYTEDGGDTWTQQPPATSVELLAVSLVAGPGCPDEQSRCHGWAAGVIGHGRGAIIHTEDGADWIPQAPTLNTVDALATVDAHHARLVGTFGAESGGDRGFVAVTDDGGQTWTTGFELEGNLGAVEPQPRLRDLSCTTRAHCHAVGRVSGGDARVKPLVVQTDDGGETWTRQDISLPATDSTGSRAGFRSVSCSDPQRCHAVGKRSRTVEDTALLIFATQDGGDTWEQQYACESSAGSDCTARSEDRATSVADGVTFADEHQHGAIVGVDGTIWTTDDGGDTWISRDAGVDDWLRDVACDSAGACLAVGGAYDDSGVSGRHRGGTGVVLASDDRGATWTVAKRSGNPDENSGGEVFTAVACDAGRCRVSGTGGTVLSTSDGGETWTAEPVASERVLNGVAMAGGRAWVGSDLGQVYSTYHPAGPVQNLEVDAVDGSTAEVRWEAPSRDGAGIPAPPATEYEVRVSASPVTAGNFGDATPCGECGEFAPEEIGDRVAATVGGLEPGTQRFVAVRAVDEAGDVGAVRSAGVRLPDDIAPGAVDDLAATASSATSVELAWSAPASNGDSGPPVRRFHVGQAGEAITAASFDDAAHTAMLCPEAGCQLPAPDAVGDTLTLPVTDLAGQTTYHYAVKPLDEAGNVGALSNVASVTTPPGPGGQASDGSDTGTDGTDPGGGSATDPGTEPSQVGAPEAVTDLTATARSASEIALSWSAPGLDGGAGPPPAEFVVKQAPAPIDSQAAFAEAHTLCGGTCTLAPETVGEALALTVTNLEPATTYHYALKPVAADGRLGPRSNPASATTLDVDALALACPTDEVAPAAFADRADIPDAHLASVDCAAWHDIVAGFADDTYRPAVEVRRDQMATFVAGTLDAAGVDLPAPSPGRFGDVAADSPHAEAVGRLAAAGVVKGGPGDLSEASYGPALRVRRDQMASFLLRAAAHATGQDLTSQTQAFPDVATTNAHFAAVNGAADAGFAQGFSDGTYRPGGSLRRHQMATFVVRLLDWTLQQHATSPTG